MILKPYIKEKRMEAHLKQIELAAKLGISKQHLNKIEKGNSYPGAELLFLIAYHCSCKVDDLYIVEI